MLDRPHAPMQRSSGTGRLSVRASEARTVLARMNQEGAAKIRLPRQAGRSDLEAVLINTAGGMTGGDCFAWSLHADAGSALTATTQACEKVYRSAGGDAHVSVELAAGRGARLAWLPQETILFDGSRLNRTISVTLDPRAHFLVVESVLFGRRESGECVRQASFHDRWRVTVDGRLVHAEDQVIDGDPLVILGNAATGKGMAAFATVLLVGPDAQDRLPAVRSLLSALPGTAAGASAWQTGGTGKLLARLAAQDGYVLRKTLVPLLDLLNGEAGLPRVWAL